MEEKTTGRRRSRKLKEQKQRKTKDGITNSEGNRSKGRRKKHFRPCSPAAYPAQIPICNDFFEDKSKLHERSKGSAILNLSEGDNSEINEVVIRNEATASSNFYDDEKNEKSRTEKSFLAFRIHYLIVHIAIMLADGLQGTHLYVLYESYGYTVASLYCLGFMSGAVTSPFIGPLVDKLGRRNSAMVYCILEIAINILEQYDLLAGLILSRVVGGVTTNLLFTVFESWLVTEHRKRGFSEDKLEIIMRDSVVASNLSAIASGCLAHFLAMFLGAKGPFEGAVVCTFVALLLVSTRWEENYGCESTSEMETMQSYMSKAFHIIISDSKIFRIGLIQGLTEGALQTFVFLWSPALRQFAEKLHQSGGFNHIGIDDNGEPNYGLIFGAFMLFGALGGVCEPTMRKIIHNAIPTRKRNNDRVNSNNVVICSNLSQPDTLVGNKVSSSDTEDSLKTDMSDITSNDEYDENEAEEEDSLAAVLLTFICYIICSLLLATPVLVDQDSSCGFTVSLVAFLAYEFLVGLYLPCEGVLRTFYMPNDSICSLMTTLRIIVNVAVALGVISTNYVPFNVAFLACSAALLVSAILQISLYDEALAMNNYQTREISSAKRIEDRITTLDEKEPALSESSISSIESESVRNDSGCHVSISTSQIGLRQRKNIESKALITS